MKEFHSFILEMGWDFRGNDPQLTVQSAGISPDCETFKVRLFPCSAQLWMTNSTSALWLLTPSLWGGMAKTEGGHLLHVRHKSLTSVPPGNTGSVWSAVEQQSSPACLCSSQGWVSAFDPATMCASLSDFGDRASGGTCTNLDVPLSENYLAPFNVDQIWRTKLGSLKSALRGLREWKGNGAL